MRSVRSTVAAVAVAAGSIALCVTLAGASAVSGVAGPAAGRVAAGRVAGGGVAGGGPAVLISPGLTHAAGAQSAPPTTTFCEANFKIACYLPQQIERAYNVPALWHKGITGKGQTIVIVDSFGSPTAAHDLGVFDKAAGLPAPASFKVIQPAGKVPAYRPTDSRVGWAGETDLDVEYAHAMAPGASILLVETPTSENEGTTGFPAIVRAEEFVISHHLGGVISQSFSATEQSFSNPRRLLALRGAYQAAFRHQVTVLAASGDSGAADVGFDGSTYFLSPVTSWPDSDPLVTGVGGTQLHLNAQGSQTRPATVWNDTFSVPTNEYISGDDGPNPLAGGGGKSAIFARPSYQSRVRKIVGSSRGVPDISMSGACNGAVDMYQSFAGQPPGWYPTCGTSEATPEFSGIVALAEQRAHQSLGLINADLYLMSLVRAPGLADVTRGNNTVSFAQGGRQHQVTGFAARPGYDLASGVGTVNAPAFVAELAWLAHHPHATPDQVRKAFAHLS
jgi:subtilase family serine protease